MDDPKIAMLARRRAEELVAMEVAANMLAVLPPPSLHQKLAADHYALSSSASPLAYAACWR